MASEETSTQYCRAHLTLLLESGIFVLLCEKYSISSLIPAILTPHALTLCVFSQRPNVRVFHRCLGWEVWGQNSMVAPYPLSRAPGK